MNRSAASLAWYRFRVTFRRRLGGYLTLAILVGLIGEVEELREGRVARAVA